MSNAQKENWLINLYDMDSQLDNATVKFVLGKYGASCIEDLSSNRYEDVYSDLFTEVANRM